MNIKSAKVILVGGGLGNALIAYRLKCLRPDIPFVILEKSWRLGGDHTWSFHESDLDLLSKPWVLKFVAHRWDNYKVFFPKNERNFRLSYASIRSGPSVPFENDFHHRMAPILAPHTLFGQTVTELGFNWVTTQDGNRHEGVVVIDGRGPSQTEGEINAGFQKFLGWVIRTKKPHGITQPIVMDTRVSQDQGFHFIYTLPFTENTLLVEDTYYNRDPRIDRSASISEILNYTQSHFGFLWHPHVLNTLVSTSMGPKILNSLHVPHLVEVESVELEESGVLPIPLSSHKPMPSLQTHLSSGLRAGLFHPTTSYSLGYAIQFADYFASTWNPKQVEGSVREVFKYQKKKWRQGSFFRRLNNMLFLAAKPDQRMRVFEHFYSKNEGLIKSFYRGSLGVREQISLLSGRPPVPVASALKTFFRPPCETARQERQTHAL